MQVNRINSAYTPTFGVKIPTRELIGFVCKASTTDNKIASSALTVTKLTNGKVEGLHIPVMDMWKICCDFTDKIKLKYPEIKDAAESVDKYASKLLHRNNISQPEYLSKLNRKLNHFEKQLGKEYDITDFENTVLA